MQLGSAFPFVSFAAFEASSVVGFTVSSIYRLKFFHLDFFTLNLWPLVPYARSTFLLE